MTTKASNENLFLFNDALKQSIDDLITSRILLSTS